VIDMKQEVGLAPEINDRVRRVARALIHATGMSRDDLAAYLHISRATMSRRSCGEQPYTAQEIEAMARLFGQRIDAFYTGQLDLALIPAQALSM